MNLQNLRHIDGYRPARQETSCETRTRTRQPTIEGAASDQDRRIAFSFWLDTYGFLNTVEVVDTVKAYRPESYYIDANPDSIPLTRVETRDDIFKVIGEIERKGKSVLVDLLGYTKAEAYRFITVMAEICQNIYRHGEKGGVHGYIAMQASHTGLRFIAVNLGPNLLAHLKSKYRLADDVTAICAACEAGVTSKKRGGLGLYRTVQIIKQAGGYISIRSGDGKALLAPDEEGDAWENDIFSTLRYLWGTQIGVMLFKKDRPGIG